VGDVAPRFGRYANAAYGDLDVAPAHAGPVLRWFGDEWPLHATAAGGYEVAMMLAGGRYNVPVLFHDDPVFGATLSLPLEPRTGWTRFRSTS
jgi:hypothetical protein